MGAEGGFYLLGGSRMSLENVVYTCMDYVLNLLLLTDHRLHRLTHLLH